MRQKLKTYDDASSLRTKRIDRCYLGKVFFACERRNAWQWTMSRTYSHDNAFSLDADGLEQHVNSNRKQGSAWSRLELAALIFTSAEASLVVTEINTRKPFRGLRVEFFESLRFGEVAECFKPQREDSIQRFVYPGCFLRPAKLPFTHWKSSFRAGKLNWVADLGDLLDMDDFYDIRYAVELVSHLTTAAQAP